jgi:hypothetical protein
MSRIEELIRIKKRDPAYTVNRLKPGPDGWERCQCPFCGKKRAQIHDARGLFWCPHDSCRIRFAVIRSTVIDTYEPLINKLVRRDPKVRKWGKWIRAEAREFCENKLLEFEASWKLADWEAQCEGNQDKLNGYVYTALRGDLLNYARDKARRARKGEHPDRAEKLVTDPGDYRGDPDAPVSSTPRAAWLRAPKAEYDQDGERYEVTGQVDYYAGQLPGRPSATVKEANSPDAKLGRYPLSAQRYGDRLTVAAVAAESGFSDSTAKRRLREERERYIDEHPDNHGKRVDLTMAYVGTRKLFADAGFTKAADTTSVAGGFPRVVMRLDVR